MYEPSAPFLTRKRRMFGKIFLYATKATAIKAANQTRSRSFRSQLPFPKRELRALKKSSEIRKEYTRPSKRATAKAKASGAMSPRTISPGERLENITLKAVKTSRTTKT